MNNKQLANRLLRFGSILISAVLFIFSLSACDSKNMNENSNETPAQESEILDSLPEKPDTNTEDDTVRTNFTVDFFGEEAGNPMSFSLDLPEGWTADPSGIFDNEDKSIASLELLKVEDVEQPFADIDKLYDNIISTEEFEVAGYPAKSYVIELKTDNGDSNLRLQYLYYIMIDDTYILVFFSPEEPIETAEADFRKIVSSIQLAQG